MNEARALSLARQGWSAVVGSGPDFTHQGPERHFDPDRLGGYWCDLRHKALHAREAPDGFPRDGDGRHHDWVIPVAQAALGEWALRLDGDPPAERHFLRFAEHLLAQALPTTAGLAWPIPLAEEKYGLSPGWVSAMGQGEAISVLLRAHALTGDPVWPEAARDAFGLLATPISQGGTQREWDGRLVLEEYPTQEPCAVLNGWIFALAGAWELGHLGGDAPALELFHRSSADLIDLLPRYDIGWWSLYSLGTYAGRADLAKPFYQRLHPVLLDALGHCVEDPSLSATAERWRRQLTPLRIGRAAGDKLVFRARRSRGRRGAHTPRPH